MKTLTYRNLMIFHDKEKTKRYKYAITKEGDTQRTRVFTSVLYVILSA